MIESYETRQSIRRTVREKNLTPVRYLRTKHPEVAEKVISNRKIDTTTLNELLEKELNWTSEQAYWLLSTISYSLEKLVTKLDKKDSALKDKQKKARELDKAKGVGWKESKEKKIADQRLGLSKKHSAELLLWSNLRSVLEQKINRALAA